MTNKEKYNLLCQSEKDIPLFLNDWWLDAACGANGWNVALFENAGEIFGAWPYAVRKKIGMDFITMPRMTNFLGPWIKFPPGQKYASHLAFEMEVMNRLFDQLPSFSFFRQRFHYSITNWLPFYWKNFRQTTRYSYILDVVSPEITFEEFKSNIRGKIRKAEKVVSVSSGFPLNEFNRLHDLTFSRQGLKSPFTFAYLQKFDAALSSRNRRKIFYAADEQGRLHSAAYLAWDNQSSYLLMVGEDPELRSSGAGILLVWEAIKFTHSELCLPKFDFLGSMIEPVEIVRRSFGAHQVPYFQLEKINSPLLRLISCFKKI